MKMYAKYYFRNMIKQEGKCKKEEKVVFCFLLHSLAGCTYTIYVSYVYLYLINLGAK